ncbi:MAG: Na/Pi cotransporter family protein [Clostridia bacterium]|nr:Na/Pi cotransporter family protein [Clostridia bacterium]
MDIFDLLSLLGGLSLFLFGMQLMGGALEKKAEGELSNVLSKMTSSPAKGFFLGIVVTAVIQSSSATTVMVVGLVNSGILNLRQAIRIIMGANIGTTVTSWILSLTGLVGDAWYIQIFKPSSFVPVLAVIGIVLFLFVKNEKHKDTGLILLGFATLMMGMDAMSESVSGLKDIPQFTNILTLFTNPILGVLAGTLITAIIQSSSASVGILQALSVTGAVTFGSAIPIIMGQNIGTCVTAMISSVGTSKNAKNAALIHLYFNIGGTVVLLTAYYFVKKLFSLEWVDSMDIDQAGIAFVHTVFNILCTVIWLPFVHLLERLAGIPTPSKSKA